MTSPPITWKWGDPVPGPEPDPSFVPLHGLSWPPPDADADDVDLDDDDEDLTTDASLVIHMHVGDAFDPSKHPRGGKPENTGEFSNAPGGGSTASVAVKGGGSLQVHVHPETAPGSGGQAAEGRTKAEPESAPLAPSKGGSGIPADHIHQMTKLPIMAEAAKFKPGQRTVTDVGRELVARGQGWLKAHGVRSGRVTEETATPQMNEAFAEAIAEEAKEALKGHNAATWYSDKVEEAVRVATLMHPKIGADANARTAFALALAVTSQGETVGRSAELADMLYAQWEKNGGRFDLKDASFSRNGGPMKANLDKYDALIAKYGADETRRFLNAEMTIRDLTKLKFKKPGGTSMDQKVNGSMIFGPKIGGGFFQNLSGNYEPVTQDLWFMRTFGRMAGTLMDTVKTDEGEQKTWDRFNRALAKETGVVIAPNQHAKMTKLAEEIYRVHERAYAKFGAEYKSGKRTKTELIKAAERVDHMLNGIQEEPGGAGARAWRVGIMNRAREKLEADGVHLTNADLQATIWYPEKDLWKHMGSRGPRGGNEDYSGALQAVARKAKHTDAELRQALGREPDPVKPAGPAKPVRASDGAGRRDLGGRAHDDRGNGRDGGQVVGRTSRGLIFFHKE